MPPRPRQRPTRLTLPAQPEHRELLARTLRLEPMQRTLGGPSLRMALSWSPLRPIRCSAALVVQKATGGRWRYDLTLDAGEPEPDDVIVIEAAIHKTSAVSFKLNNAFDADAPFVAQFTPESPSAFSVKPAAGDLARAGADGTLFTVAYSPIEYGKVVRGTLVIRTADVQWSYEVRGKEPPYQVPNVGGGRVDHQLDPNVTSQLGGSTKNFVKANIRK